MYGITDDGSTSDAFPVQWGVGLYELTNYGSTSDTFPLQ